MGTGDEVERILRLAGLQDIAPVVSNPEFLREGAAIDDFKRPDRIVVGTDVASAVDVMRAIYRPLYLNRAPLLFCSRRSAELIKYAANAFLATKISFINEMADLCEAVGAEVQDVAHGMGMDKRIGEKFLHAGPGYGGSCFPKDTQALLRTARDHGSPLHIVETVSAVNDHRKSGMARRVVKAIGGDVRDRKIAVLGLTFKPNTDDMREAPSIALIQGLCDAGAEVHAYDPEGMDQARAHLDGVTFAGSAIEAARDAAAVVIMTEWDEFRALDLPALGPIMEAPILIDLRNIYSPAEVAAAGFTYHGIGRMPARTSSENIYPIETLSAMNQSSVASGRL